MSYLFRLLIVSLEAQKFLILLKTDFSIFPLVAQKFGPIRSVERHSEIARSGAVDTHHGLGKSWGVYAYWREPGPQGLRAPSSI